MRAYWQVMRASNHRARGGSRPLTPTDLRMMAGIPASAGDLAHVWLLSHPPPKTGQDTRTAMRSQWKKAGTSDKALDFWLQ